MTCQPRLFSVVDKWLLINQTCLVCDERTDTPLPLCAACELELPWLGDRCERCALPLPMAGLTCGLCIKHPPAYESVYAPWVYGFPVDSLIIRFKHNSRWPYGRLLADILGQSLRDRFNTGDPQPDCLLPVPLSTQRLRQRGYNQAAMLAQWLSRDLGIPFHDDWLLRHQDTAAQQALDAKARKRNLLHAFSLAPQVDVRGLHLALVDDVLTTGATAQSLARLLRQAGARQVDVYCLARTPRPDAPP
ncbi:MAG: Amidophosphoribosyltransferase [Pseudomonas helleri]|jgi:ComF family protein|uniref:ComF family protein n=2 Tax=Pseudomonas helleri TaxID=1608996 RepID=UPI003A101FDE